MALSPGALRLFEYLPADGTNVGSITIKKELGWRDPEFRIAKDELREAGLVIFGRGRGGSVARVEGKEPEKAPSSSERMAHARAAKISDTRERKARALLRQAVLEYAQKEFPQVKERHISFTGADMKPIIEVWQGRCAKMYTVPEEDWEKMQ